MNNGESNLRKDFENLIISLGEDITSNCVVPVVSEKFNEIENKQKEYITNSTKSINHIQNSLKDEITEYLTETISILGEYENVISRYESINANLVNNLDKYILESNDFKMTEKLIDNTENLFQIITDVRSINQDINENMMAKLDVFKTLLVDTSKEYHQVSGELSRLKEDNMKLSKGLIDKMNGLDRKLLDTKRMLESAAKSDESVAKSNAKIISSLEKNLHSIGINTKFIDNNHLLLSEIKSMVNKINENLDLQNKVWKSTNDRIKSIQEINQEHSLTHKKIIRLLQAILSFVVISMGAVAYFIYSRGF